MSNNMKNIFLTTILLYMLNLSVNVFAEEEAKSYFILDTAKSYIRWEGKKLLGSHSGKIMFDSSYVEMTNGKISNGEFKVDMSTITCDDIEDSTLNMQLVQHLKRDDFFGVDKYPYSFLNFKIAIPNPTAKKEQPNYTFISEMTIKDTTHTITFPAEVRLNDRGMTAEAEFDFDRTKYGIHFNSIKFFPDIADKVIEDRVNLKIKIFMIREDMKDTIKNKELQNQE